MKPGPVISALVVGILIGAGVTYAVLPHATGTSTSGQAAIDKLREGTAEPTGNPANAIYKNSHYGFSIEYPIEYTQADYPAGTDALTVVFQKPDEEKGFQIFIVPYPEAQITQERIKGDLKGAPMKNVTEVVLPGNIRAIHFNSSAPIIGDSSEVWFIHGGYLYEVTTYAALDTELAGIVGTLKFTK